MMNIARMSVALELDLLQIWGGVDLVRCTDLMPADRLRIGNLLIVRGSDQMLCHRARVSHEIRILNHGHVLVCRHGRPLLQAYSSIVDLQRFKQGLVRFRLRCGGPWETNL